MVRPITTNFVFCFVLFVFALNSRGVSTRRSLKYIVDEMELSAVSAADENPNLIVGVLTQEMSSYMLHKFPDDNFKSYIAASYVKFVEGAGARVVPIWIGRSHEYYVDTLSKINGVLLPGGSTLFNRSRGYSDAGRQIYEIAVELNNKGIYFPIWGTCLGFELLVYLSANGTEPRTDCSSSAQALPLEFTKDFRQSRMFRNASYDVIDILKNYPVTANFHIYCLAPKTFDELGLNKTWKVMSLNHDWNGVEFISSIEHRTYPFYGVQFHPEKNIYEHKKKRNITNSSRAVRASQYFADFFISESRRNDQRFANSTEETMSLIYNYSPKYTGVLGSAFEQQYLFEDEDVLFNRRNVAITCFKGLQNIISITINLAGLLAFRRILQWY